MRLPLLLRSHLSRIHPVELPQRQQCQIQQPKVQDLGLSRCRALALTSLYTLPGLLVAIAPINAQQRIPDAIPLDGEPPRPSSPTDRTHSEFPQRDLQNARQFEQRLQRIRRQLNQEQTPGTPSSITSPFGDPNRPFPPGSLTPGTLPEDKFQRYRLGAGDQLFISVQRFPDLTFQGVVNPEGAIVLPLIGNINLQGLTLQEAQETVRRGYDRYFVNPVVNLSLLAQRPVQVTVIGKVFRPGFYPLAAGRVGDALLVAGGSLANADLRAVQVRRTFLDGSVQERLVDLYAPLAGGTSMPDLRLEDGDVVVVPELEKLDDPDYNRALVASSTLAKPTIRVRLLSYAAGGATTLTLPSTSSFRDVLDGIPLNAAKLNSVALIRFDPGSQKAVTQTLNAQQVLMGDRTQDIPLQDNDVVIIGRNLVARITYALNTFTQPFRDVLGFLLFFDSLSRSATNLFQPDGSGR